MSGQLQSAATQHERLAHLERLCLRDRSRARLWIGTALRKEGNNDYEYLDIHSTFERQPRIQGDTTQ